MIGLRCLRGLTCSLWIRPMRFQPRPLWLMSTVCAQSIGPIIPAASSAILPKTVGFNSSVHHIAAGLWAFECIPLQHRMSG